ncbi:uncharacterized protein DS421_12g382120 [Arachis hypogaea]|nr:uncharacterized protein DS421_12g382120 [Arachis hypogaea]
MAALAPLDPPLPLIMLMISGSDSLSKRTLRKEERKAPPTSSAAMFTRSRKYERVREVVCASLPIDRCHNCSLGMIFNVFV